jgi:hypothetical protein
VNWKSVKSSNLARVGYNADSQELGVEFHNGERWAYEPVTSGEHESLMSARPSMGSHFHKHIKTNRRIRARRIE